MLLAPAVLACSVNFPNHRPHAIANSQDAVAAAYANWDAKFPHPAGSLASWRKIYSAKLVGRNWVLTPTVPGAKAGLGTRITISAESGCIVSEMSFD